ncbi:hypothetical protein [Streptomyces sp. WAC01280]|uniref:hypothetical protein n=1 Tax=Streptomyces sp. WAC01280 TaxID=2487424 RepID=UPI000F79DE03|nr:hypothetical protein [Streptomyces sp. WAC01280]RSS59824.1 hypothetical protein EF909_08155 [Streptomyces sp. WAC01280]
MNPNSTPPEGLSARRSAPESEKAPGVVGGENEAQAGVQGPGPQAVTLDAISTALNAAGYWLPIEGKRAVVNAVLKASGDEARAIVERVRNAVAIADATDVTDWQRGYRACADRVLAALQHEEQP